MSILSHKETINVIELQRKLNPQSTDCQFFNDISRDEKKEVPKIPGNQFSLVQNEFENLKNEYCEMAEMNMNQTLDK